MRLICNQTDLKTAIEAVVGYLWISEEADYERQPSEDHIFIMLQALDSWVNGDGTI